MLARPHDVAATVPVMLSDDHDAACRVRLQAIAELIGVQPDAGRRQTETDIVFELLMLCLELPGAAEQSAALAYLRLLKRGIPK